MLRTEPAALSLPGPFGAAGFHPRLSQRQKQACCDRSGHAAPGAPWPALFASRQTDAGL
ncbi:hypothetical protein N4C55_004242 [Salmonella enterica]|nr:hypothetical protein [Salmonella enterica]